MTAARNPVLLYDLEALTDHVQILYHKQHRAVRQLIISPDRFTLEVDASDPEILKIIRNIVGKMQQTLDNCRRAVNGRTPFQITQERIVLKEFNGA